MASAAEDRHHTGDAMNTALPRCPEGPDWSLRWETLLKQYRWLREMEGCPQDPIHHAEGDVLIHTRMVCEALVADPAWRALPEAERAILFAAALLHDVAKPACTQTDPAGRIRSPGHAKRGDREARAILWEDGASPGDREAVAALVRYHQMPYLLWDRPDPARLVRQISMRARCDWLALLARADIKGRVCPDASQQLESIALFVAQCEELDCLRQPAPFPSDHSRFEYFRREDRDPNYAAWDDTRCTLTLMCGLPGAGKDHWLREHDPALPVVSLDALRRSMGVSWGDDQGAVAHAARERAREFLRQGQSLAWNATNLTQTRRAPLISLAESYRARVRIVCVDPPAAQLMRQNQDRDATVPRAAIWELLEKWEMPDLTEAHALIWVV
jgi:predicted kinase